MATWSMNVTHCCGSDAILASRSSKSALILARRASRSSLVCLATMGPSYPRRCGGGRAGTARPQPARRHTVGTATTSRRWCWWVRLAADARRSVARRIRRRAQAGGYRRRVRSPAAALAPQFGAQVAQCAPHRVGCGGETHDVAGALHLVADPGGEHADGVGVAAVVQPDVGVGAGRAEREGGWVHAGRADGDVAEGVIGHRVVAVAAGVGEAVR